MGYMLLLPVWWHPLALPTKLLSRRARSFHRSGFTFKGQVTRSTCYCKAEKDTLDKTALAKRARCITLRRSRTAVC